MSNKRKNDGRAKKKKKASASGCFVLLLLFVGTVLVLCFTPLFNLSEIIVIGNSTVQSSDIVAAAKLERGKNIFLQHIGDIKTDVSTLPYINTATAKRIFPNKIRIDVTETKEFAVVFALDESLVVDSSGKVLKVLAKGEMTQLPQIDRLNIAAYTIGKPLAFENQQPFLDIVLYITKLSGTSIAQSPIIVSLDKLDNVIVETNSKKLKINFGNTENIEYKINSVIEVMKNLGKTPAGEIDASNISKSVIYRAEQH